MGEENFSFFQKNFRRLAHVARAYTKRYKQNHQKSAPYVLPFSPLFCPECPFFANCVLPCREKCVIFTFSLLPLAIFAVFCYNKKCKIVDKLFLSRFKKKGIFFDAKSNLSAKFLRDRGLESVFPIGVWIDLERLQSRKMLESPLSNSLQSLKNGNKKIITYDKQE